MSNSPSNSSYPGYLHKTNHETLLTLTKHILTTDHTSNLILQKIFIHLNESTNFDGIVKCQSSSSKLTLFYTYSLAIENESITQDEILMHYNSYTTRIHELIEELIESQEHKKYFGKKWVSKLEEVLKRS